MQHPIDVPEAPFAVRGHRRNGVDRLSLFGALDGRTVSKLESALDDIAHAGGALLIDLRNLDSVDIEAVRALEEIARCAAEGGWLLFIVNVQPPVREVFEREVPAISSVSDVSGPPGLRRRRLGADLAPAAPR